ncbi:MAG: c-type cytochrome domain-containing protein [Longimicrobiales bacterium]
MASEIPPPDRRPGVDWPDGGQIVRQVAILAAVLVVWSGLFWGAMRIPGAGSGERDAATDARRDARRAAAEAAPVTDSAARVEAAPPAVETPDTAAPPVIAEAQPAPPVAADVVEPEAEPEPPSSDPLPAAPVSDVPMEEIVLDPIDEAAAAGEDLGEVSFAADVLPILERRCIKCHGGLRDDGTRRLEEGLSLQTVEDILAGSTWGSVVEPGDLAGSYLYELVEEGDMPDNEPRLLPRELRVIAAWIRQGARAN